MNNTIMNDIEIKLSKRRYLVSGNYLALSSITCDNEEDQETKKIIKDFGTRAFRSISHTKNKERLDLLKSFIDKYENQLDEKQLDSFNVVINNVNKHYGIL